MVVVAPEGEGGSREPVVRLESAGPVDLGAVGWRVAPVEPGGQAVSPYERVAIPTPDRGDRGPSRWAGVAPARAWCSFAWFCVAPCLPSRSQSTSGRCARAF